MADRNVLARALQALETRRISNKRQPKRVANLMNAYQKGAGGVITEREYKAFRKIAESRARSNKGAYKPAKGEWLPARRAK